MLKKKGVYNISLPNNGDVSTEFGPSILFHGQNTSKGSPNKSNLEQPMVDPLTSVIGEIGPFQIIMCLTMGSVGLVLGWFTLSNKFYTTKVDHWCARPTVAFNMSVENWLNISSPLLDGGNFDRCHMFDIDYETVEERPDENTTTKKCDAWEYDHQYLQNTVIERWNLVCDNDNHFNTYANSLYFAGNLFGILMLGILADWYGRKKALLFFLTTSLGFSLGSYFAPNPIVWMVLRFFCGASFLAADTVKAIIQVEITSGIWRSRFQHWFGEVFWQLAILSLGGLIYLIPDTRNLELFCICMLIPHIVVYVFLPESPRWLLAKGRVKEAKKVIATAIKLNKMPVDGIDHIEATEKPLKHGNIFHLLKPPAIRRNLLCMGVCWTSFAMGYFGLIFNTPVFDWNIYLVFVFPTFFCLPQAFALPFLENKLGRKVMLFGSQFLAGLSLLSTALIPDGKFVHNWPVVALCWLGTIGATAAFGAGYTYTKELFPTPVRTTALTTCSAFARIGSISSPYVALLSDISPIFSLVVYGMVFIIGAISSLFIWPETTQQKMFETIEECEKVSSTKNTWLICCKN